MVTDAKEVQSAYSRETIGRFYEDFIIGDVYKHPLGRTISQADNTWFTLVTMNTHPIHFDEVYASKTEFGRCIVCSPLTLALLVGMSVGDVSQRAIANLGWTDIKLTHPVYAGDTLYAESEVLSARVSKSRRDAGIIQVRTIGRNQEDTIVCTFERTILVPRRKAS